MSDPRRSTGRRATDRDRPLTLHGPVIRRIIVAQAIALLCSLIALGLTIFFFSGKIDKATERADLNTATLAAVQSSRKGALFDSCKLLQKLVLSAAAQSPRDGRSRAQAEAAALRYLVANGIADCHAFVRNTTQLRVTPPPPS